MAELKVYTTNEAVEILKVSQRTLYNYIKAGQIKATKIGRNWRIPENELKRFINQGTDKNYLETL